MPRHRSIPRGRDPFDPLDGPIDHVLDLHGMNRIEVPGAVASFLASACRRTPSGLAHIITGRGRGSTAGPVLKPLVKRLLEGEVKRYVAAFGRDLTEGGYLIRLVRL